MIELQAIRWVSIYKREFIGLVRTRTDNPDSYGQPGIPDLVILAFSAITGGTAHVVPTWSISGFGGGGGQNSLNDRGPS